MDRAKAGSALGRLKTVPLALGALPPWPTSGPKTRSAARRAMAIAYKDKAERETLAEDEG